MALLADFLKDLIDRAGMPNKDQAMNRSPSEIGAESADSGVMTPDQMMRQSAKDPTSDRNTMSDSGTITGWNEFADSPIGKKLLKGGGEGTLTGFLQKLQGDPSATPSSEATTSKSDAGAGTLSGFLKRNLMSQDTGVLGTQGTVGGGVGSDHTPGTGVDPALNPTPTAKQRIAKLAPVDRGNVDSMGNPAGVTEIPKDYSQPTALDPNQIEELRKSLLTQAGQMDPNNPNGLSGRMNSPMSKLDQGSQMNETQQMADQLNRSKSENYADRNNRKVRP